MVSRKLWAWIIISTVFGSITITKITLYIIVVMGISNVNCEENFSILALQPCKLIRGFITVTRENNMASSRNIFLNFISDKRKCYTYLGY